MACPRQHAVRGQESQKRLDGRGCQEDLDRTPANAATVFIGKSTSLFEANY